MYKSMVKNNPQLEFMLHNPEFIKQMFTKENLQLAQQMQQPENYFPMDGFGFRATENLGPNEIRVRYPNAIQQLEEMGIVVDDHVLQVLHRFQGDVGKTIDFLME